MDSTHSENRIVDLLSDASLDVVGINVDTGAVGVGPTRTASRISSEIEEVASDGPPTSTTVFGPQHLSDIDECIRNSYLDVTLNKSEIAFPDCRIGETQVSRELIIGNVNMTKLNLIATQIPASFGISKEICIAPGGGRIEMFFEPKSPDALVGTNIFGRFHFTVKESGQNLSVAVCGRCY